MKRIDPVISTPGQLADHSSPFEPQHPTPLEYHLCLDHSPFPNPRSHSSEVSCQGIRVVASLGTENGAIPFGLPVTRVLNQRRVIVEAASNVLGS